MIFVYKSQLGVDFCSKISFKEMPCLKVSFSIFSCLHVKRQSKFEFQPIKRNDFLRADFYDDC